jgi:hypothetical protein
MEVVEPVPSRVMWWVTLPSFVDNSDNRLPLAVEDETNTIPVDVGVVPAVVPFGAVTLETGR